MCQHAAMCRFREPEALAEARATYHDDIERFIALQWIFDDQWSALKVSLAISTLLLLSYC